MTAIIVLAAVHLAVRPSGIVPGEARWFDRHPLPGLGIIGLLIIVGIAIGYAGHH